VHTLLGNLLPPLRLLEIVRSLEKRPFICYCSSFNALYGYPPGTVFTESLLPNPSTVYGWSKGCAENLYRAYYISFKIPVVITRIGSSFGARMRSDELVARLIIFGLKRRKFVLRSPLAKRLWTYSKDAMRFYRLFVEQLLKDPQKFVGKVLHLAGNKGDRIVTNVELAQTVKRFVPELEWVEGEYEPGELVDGGRPVDFKVDSTYTRRLLNWEPIYSLEEGIRETVEWFRLNIHRYL
jgi:dTDP-glucose 4,6-dehydratase